MCFCYILKSTRTGRYYIGSTDDLIRRYWQHQNGRNSSTKAYIPWICVHLEVFPNRQAAGHRERQIKKWKSKVAIEKLIEGTS
ncbi:MAG: GIY-YIG nuclease family protein [Blastochloris sp.]|nr:GIY-YIG nuclease family protein [Blastochloris sp.]